jgi:hypothetical protein
LLGKLPVIKKIRRRIAKERGEKSREKIFTSIAASYPLHTIWMTREHIESERDVEGEEGKKIKEHIV